MIGMEGARERVAKRQSKGGQEARSGRVFWVPWKLVWC